jgi:GT2 family glycosyltransferase
LSEPIPRFGSKRFRQAFFSALIGDPGAALSGFYWLATRRRVRGWSKIAFAAAKGPAGYRRWVDHGEPMAFAAYRRMSRQLSRPKVVPILLEAGDQDERSTMRTIDSLRTALQGRESPDGNSRMIAPLVLSPVAPITASLAGLPARQDDGWLLLMLVGDVLSPELGDILTRRFRAETDVSLVFWDEDQLSSRGREKPWIKPGWDKLLFEQLDGLVGACVVRQQAFRDAAERHPELNCSREDLEALLRDVASNCGSARPEHIPLVLTHRASENAVRFDRQRPLASALPVTGEWPAVSVLIPTRDQPALLAACLQGVRALSYPGRVEIIIIDNGTVELEAIRIIEAAMLQPGVVVIRDEQPFNFSRLNNLAATRATGQMLCLLNNDVEPLDSDWLRHLVVQATQPDVGAVGAQLVYPSGRIQHAGVVIGLGQAAGHVQKGVWPESENHWTWHGVSREVSAVTAAVLVIRRDVFLDIGGLDEEAFPVAFNDVDLCLRLNARGFRNLYIAEARLIHRESETRGDDTKPANASRFAGELRRLQERWGTENFEDRHFSPLFSRMTERCLLLS